MKLRTMLLCAVTILGILDKASAQDALPCCIRCVHYWDGNICTDGSAFGFEDGRVTYDADLRRRTYEVGAWMPRPESWRASGPCVSCDERGTPYQRCEKHDKDHPLKWCKRHGRYHFAEVEDGKLRLRYGPHRDVPLDIRVRSQR